MSAEIVIGSIAGFFCLGAILERGCNWYNKRKEAKEAKAAETAQAVIPQEEKGGFWNGMPKYRDNRFELA